MQVLRIIANIFLAILHVIETLVCMTFYVMSWFGLLFKQVIKTCEMFVSCKKMEQDKLSWLDTSICTSLQDVIYKTFKSLEEDRLPIKS